MYKSSFEGTDDFNSFMLRFSDATKTIPLTQNLYALLSLKQFDSIRNILLSSNDKELSVSESLQNYEGTYPDSISSLSEYLERTEALYSSSGYTSETHFLFPYSKQKLLETFMFDMLPSFRFDLYTYLSDELDLFRQIGSGSGSAFLIKLYSTNSDAFVKNINSQCSVSSQISSVKTTVSKITSVLEKQNTDIHFMSQYIEQLESLVRDLTQQLDQEKKQGVNGYYRTWH